MKQLVFWETEESVIELKSTLSTDTKKMLLIIISYNKNYNVLVLLLKQIHWNY